jgi:hypothetical protein
MIEDASNDASVQIIEQKKEYNIEVFASPVKRQKSVPSKRALNRWGMEVDETTESQKKRLRNQKQSKIDGFFKNPPKPPSREGSPFKRVSHADTDMERALQLSRQSLRSVLTAAAEQVEEVEEVEDEEVGERQHDDPNCPAFAHIGPAVRKK